MPRPCDLLNLDGSANLTALLGPTNTGKTWAAIERMLEHRTGMIGLPLRLLAREVYDRVSARVGEHAVALVTGEEKRVPADPRYFVCTVEAMPVTRPVSFLAVDEIQLCGHRERGHVFTDRLLHARGVHETMFMGADTLQALLQRIVPTARIARNPRFSKLSYAGPRKLAALPPRTAVVAFSASEVYELAERLRVRHGGTAVVLGALSPRTRNAQVAMYQAGEVQYLVATDAIGMGLNLDVDMVAFASLRKFDGARPRALEPAEVGQIAGRAGRYKRDGRWGPVAPLEGLPEDLVEAVETHRFPPLTRLQWRNTDLDFSTVEALLQSLQVPSPAPYLVAVRDAEDQVALEALVGLPEIQALARGQDRVRLLWEVCQIPDYRKTLTSGHASLLARLYPALAGPKGRLDDDFLRRQVERLDRVDGDIETLMTRLAWIRTWTYVSFRSDWVESAEAWQARTRDIEDRLSDALHDRLSRRFVDRRAVVLLQGAGGGTPLDPTVGSDGLVTAGGVDLGRLVGFDFVSVAGPGSTLPGREVLDRAIARLLAPVLADRVARLAEAPFEAFEVDGRGRILWDGAPVALLAPGETVLDPRVRLVRLDLLGPGARALVERRLVAWVRDRVAALLAPLRREEAARLSPAGRGLVWMLEQGLGTVATAEARAQGQGLSHLDRTLLARLDVRLGVHHVYVASLLQPAEVALRGVLHGVFRRIDPLPAPPAGPSVARGAIPAETWRCMGYPVVGPRAVRADVLEDLAARARRAAQRSGRRGALVPSPERAAALECPVEDLVGILEALGFVIDRGEGRP